VTGNLRFWLKEHGAGAATLIDEALQQVGLAGFAHRDPATLSGGQKARGH
jgi:putative thiamine transport system ATP-binding protein